MKKRIVLVLAALAGAALVPRPAAAQAPAPQTAAPRTPQPPTAPSGPVRHLVAFRFREGTTDEQVRQVTDAFRALKDSIPGILSFEHGVNNSPEGHAQGHRFVYLMTFRDAAARDAYLPHPAHRAFGALLGRLGVFEGVFVVDWVPNE